MKQKKLTPEQKDDLINNLKKGFASHMNRHQEIDWSKLEEKLRRSSKKLWSLHQMEESGGEPDVVDYDSGEYIFFD